MRLGEKIRVMRGNTSQAKLAAALGFSQNLISTWERNTAVPTVFEAKTLADHFGVPVAYLADDALDEPPPPLLTGDEEFALRAVRAAGLSGDQIIEAIMAWTHQQKSSAATSAGEAGAERALNITVREDLRGFQYPEIKRKGRTPKTDPETSGRKDQ